MQTLIPPSISLSDPVSQALAADRPVVALESTVITHGLPYPENLTLAEDMEAALLRHGVTPATIAVIDGRVRVGLHPSELHELASNAGRLLKISQRDIAPAIARLASGGTTVAATMFLAHSVGIRLFATGGIGGVHFELRKRPRAAGDVSADLPALARIPMIVVCAGAKAILDLQATLEYLETWSIPVVGFRTDEFPAFYAAKSGFKVSARADTPEEVALIASAHWRLGMHSAVLVAVPPPDDVAMDIEAVRQAVIKALREARDEGISGSALTPFLLQRVVEHSGGDSLRANLGLLLRNAEVAAQIAACMPPRETPPV